jgi:N-acyl-D-amino-acid deacylase
MSERDLLVRGGTLVDGTGSPPRPADVRVRAGQVCEIGENLRPEGEAQLDATGAFVTPGFIDTHTHLDPTLFWDESCDPMPQHGVTFVVFGNCGLSLAPVHDADVGAVSDLFCYVEDLPRQVFDACIPWTWESYAEFVGAVGDRTLSVNAGGLVGHSILRIYVMGEEAWDRPARPDEIERMRVILSDALAAGAYGLSTSLGFDTDRHKRPVPSRLAEDAELRVLFEELARRGRIVQFIPSTVPKYLVRDVRRVADLSKDLGLTQTWINVFDDARRPEYSLSLMELASELQHEGVPTFPQISPRPLDIEVNWSGGMSFYTMEQSWHVYVQASANEKRGLLQDPAWRAKARDEWDRVPFTMIEHRHPENIVLHSVGDPALAEWTGRSFEELCRARGGHPSDVLADWLIENDLDCGLVAMGVANSDPDGVARLLQHPAGVVSNSDAGAHVQMMCAVGDTTLLLARHVRDRRDLTIEDAIHKMTARPARVFGIPDRGIVRVGWVADLCVFDLNELAWQPASMVEDWPLAARRQRRPHGGYRATVISGEITQQEGQLTEARPGRFSMPTAA